MRFFLALLLALPLHALAQYPQRAVKLIVPFPPEQFVERIRSDAVRWAEVIRTANVRLH